MCAYVHSVIHVPQNMPLIQLLMPGEAVLCRRPGAMVNKLEMQWLEGIWIGREATTDDLPHCVVPE